jgi:hypothetical protein
MKLEVNINNKAFMLLALLLVTVGITVFGVAYGELNPQITGHHILDNEGAEELAPVITIYGQGDPGSDEYPECESGWQSVFEGYGAKAYIYVKENYYDPDGIQDIGELDLNPEQFQGGMAGGFAISGECSNVETTYYTLSHTKILNTVDDHSNTQGQVSACNQAGDECNLCTMCQRIIQTP